jgi:selenocysteine-specific elongation factor
LRDAGGAHDLVRDAVRRAGVLGATAVELRAARLVEDAALEPALADLAAAGTLVRGGEAYYDAARLADAEHALRRFAIEHQRANPLAWGIGRAELQERLGHRGSKARFGELLDVVTQRSRAVAAGGGGAADAAAAIHLRPDAVRVGSAERDLAPADAAALERIESLLREGGATPPTPGELRAAVGAGPRFAAFVSMLEEKGALVRVGDSLLYHRAALEALESSLRDHLAGHERMTMADFKDLTGLSRKFAVPLLEYFDRKGVTQRFGDDRRPGPAMRTR